MKSVVPAKEPNRRPATSVDLRSTLLAFESGTSEATYAEDDVVFHQGDIADAVFYIVAGNIRISVVSEQGKEGVIATLRPGDFFGEGCLAGQPVHLASATVVDRAIAIRTSKEAMIRELHDKPAFAEAFTAFLLVRNIRTEADLVDQLFNSSERRLARMLLLLANFGKDGKMEMVIAPISQELLAARVGTTRSRINFFMNKFRKLGFIEYHSGHLKVHSSLLNLVIHDPLDAPESRRALGAKTARKARPTN